MKYLISALLLFTSGTTYCQCQDQNKTHLLTRSNLIEPYFSGKDTLLENIRYEVLLTHITGHYTLSMKACLDSAKNYLILNDISKNVVSTVSVNDSLYKICYYNNSGQLIRYMEMINHIITYKSTLSESSKFISTYLNESGSIRNTEFTENGLVHCETYFNPNKQNKVYYYERIYNLCTKTWKTTLVSRCLNRYKIQQFTNGQRTFRKKIRFSLLGRYIWLYTKFGS